MAGNVYQDSAKDPKGTQGSLLGKPYNYANNIKTTGDLGISDKGNMETLAKDINGMFAYVNLLISEDATASKTGQALGDKFFMKTGGQCKTTDTQKSVDRYIYVNNVPTRSTPGLIGGIIQNVTKLNPFALMGAFMQSDTPKCMPITMETINADSNKGQETQYVALAEVRDMESSTFPGGNKPGVPEGFANYYDMNDPSVKMPDDMIIQLYFVCLAIVGLYILYRLGNR
jgi:hypothetical protein